jgi:flagellar biosynthesis protein FlhG
VGGGKGGIGKSVVASSLAAAIAATGRRCAVIDADLGGANLHTLLGVSKPRRHLSQLLAGEVTSLEELMVPTSVPNLWLVSGDQALLEMANPKHHQKEKLSRHIRGLDVDEVVLDLGSGTAFNVLDFFLLAHRQLVVATPEPTAIENAEHFLRAALHRSLRAVTRLPEVRAAILGARDACRSGRVRSAGELIAQVRAIHPPAAKLLDERAAAFTPVLLVNQVAGLAHRGMGSRLVDRCHGRVGVPVALAGSITRDPNVPEAVAHRQPVIQAFPGCEFSRQIESLARSLLSSEWDCPREAAAPSTRPLSPPGEAVPSRTLPPLDSSAPGAYLRRCREALGVSLQEMIERTRIRALPQIETERFDELPPEPYLRGYLLSYAQELGVTDFPGLVTAYLTRLSHA